MGDNNNTSLDFYSFQKIFPMIPSLEIQGK